MGARQSSLEYEKVAEDYDALHKVRKELFPDNYSNEEWHKILKDFEPSEVFSKNNGFKIFVGGMPHAQNVEMLRRKGISHVVNMAGRNCPTDQDFYGEDFKCLVIMAEDVEEYDLSQHFTEVSEFLEVAEKDGAAVLVHCMAGVSRSVTVTVAFLMKCQSMSLKDASQKVHRGRPQAFPNVRFMQNLLELEKELKVQRQKKSAHSN